MANDEDVALLKQGVAAWNAWREANPNILPDLSEADLSGANLGKADLSTADLSMADLSGADLSKANLSIADLTGADLGKANLTEADLSGANLSAANLAEANLTKAGLAAAKLMLADLTEADLSGAWLGAANLSEADLSRANLGAATLASANLTKARLSGANLGMAQLMLANFTEADLTEADLGNAYLTEANLTGADLSGAKLWSAILEHTDLTGATLTGCRIFGVSAWGLKVEGAKQRDLVITRMNEPEITVDNIEVAQFVYLLLHNEKIRDVIDTIGKKGVLLLGRFTEGRMLVLERLRDKLRDLGFVPMVFNFDKPETKDFTETVRLLASLSKFVIVDITNPRSAPLELQATVPDYMVPFVPILQHGEEPFSMFVDLQNKYDWVLQPVVGYPSVDRLIEVLEDKVVRPAEAKFNELLARRTKLLRVENV
jgi:uncharacterized protein YjbI with pentapeptide repeats